MSTDRPLGHPAQDGPGAGRTRLTRHAMERVGRALTADALSVALSDVRVVLADSAGRLDLTIRSPLDVQPLSRGGTTPLLERCATAEASIRTCFRHLTGRPVGRLTLRITDVELARRNGPS